MDSFANEAWPLGGLRYAVFGSIVPASIPSLLWGPDMGGNNALPGVEDDEMTAPEPAPVGKRLAVLVGISKYTRRRMSDLEYADDDVVHWYEYLRRLGFECKIYGDEFSPYPHLGPLYVFVHRSPDIDGTGLVPSKMYERQFKRWWRRHMAPVTGWSSSQAVMAQAMAEVTPTYVFCQIL